MELSDRRSWHSADGDAPLAPAAGAGDLAALASGAAAWDVVVIGTGMGGATIGRRLVEAGRRVLFLERGRIDARDSQLDPVPEERGARLALGHWPDRIRMVIDGKESRTYAPLGCGAGGSTILYAAALERFDQSDMEAVDGALPPHAEWPVPWSEWSRYYAEAEQLFHVAGTPDPLGDGTERLHPPSPLNPLDATLMEAFDRIGLHPYRLHVGIRDHPECGDCGGRRCLRACKSDARLICLEPALRSGRAALVGECEALRIRRTGDRVTGVLVEQAGVAHEIRAGTVVLAAGAYHSPALLLRSDCAGRSGMVGRNLMFHANEWFAIWARRPRSDVAPRKTIGLRDMMSIGGERLGSIQSTGFATDVGLLYAFMLLRLQSAGIRSLRASKIVCKIVSHLVGRILGSATTFVMLIEDRPYRDNRIEIGADNDREISVFYSIPPELRRRARLARRSLRRAFRGLRLLPLQSWVDLNFGHPCGTCRFGKDPQTSVLDPDCRVHDVANLYVVDASFMPTSGRANPALTIAANALRVGDILSRKLAEMPAVEGIL